ncbi:MAG: hypothetical protein AB8E15_03725 [Bdellovibrionales bacterium]
MLRIHRLFLVIFMIVCIPLTDLYAQNQVKSSTGTRRQMATIVFAGLSGAVLGLSTLSFYGRPQDKLANIAVGFALGIITGSIATTYSATARPDEFYGRDLMADFTSPQFDAYAAHNTVNSMGGVSIISKRWTF